MFPPCASRKICGGVAHPDRHEHGKDRESAPGVNLPKLINIRQRRTHELVHGEPVGKKLPQSDEKPETQGDNHDACDGRYDVQRRRTLCSKKLHKQYKKDEKDFDYQQKLQLREHLQREALIEKNPVDLSVKPLVDECTVDEQTRRKSRACEGIGPFSPHETVEFMQCECREERYKTEEPVRPPKRGKDDNGNRNSGNQHPREEVLKSS